jgi:hypothetical protein
MPTMAIPNPDDPSKKAARETMQSNVLKGNPRDFRDALTRAKGAVPGIPTEVKLWDRWDR